MAGPQKPRPFNNVDMLNRIRYDASSDYQRRVPDVTKANVDEALSNLTNYRPAWNEFCDALINRVGSYITRDVVWQNPLAKFKRNTLTYGSDIEEAQVGLVKAYGYNEERDALEGEVFGVSKPDVQSQYHTISRKDKYKISVNEMVLRRAFLESDGLSKFVNQVLQSPITSDAWDEFLLMCSLLPKYEEKGGFFHIQVPDIQGLGAPDADVRTFIKKVQATAGNLQFLDTKYTPSRMPTWGSRENLVLLTSPETMASVNVDAWAAAFNLDKQIMTENIVEIPRYLLGDDKTQAVLTTKDFFVVCDTLLENTSMYNPAALNTNYWLHHHEIISASLFVPAVKFWTGASDDRVVAGPTNLELKADAVRHADGTPYADTEAGRLKAGENGYISYTIVGTNLPNGAEIPVDFWVKDNNSDRTRVYNDGTIVIAADETASTIKIGGKITGGGTLKAAAGGNKAGGEFEWTIKITPSKALWPKG